MQTLFFCWLLCYKWRLAVPQFRRLVADFPPWWPRLDPRSGHVGFVVDRVVLGKGFPEYFSFLCQFSFHLLLHINHHLSPGAGTVGLTDVPSGLTLTSPQEIKIYIYIWRCITMEILLVHVYKKAPFFRQSEIIDAYRCAVSCQITSERDQFRLNLLLFCILCLKI
jgi:hypothetical protein